MKNKEAVKLTRLIREPHVDGLTLGEQIDVMLKQSNRQAMSERIKAGIARKKDRDMTKMSIKGRTKRYDHNVTRVRQPHPIKTRN